MPEGTGSAGRPAAMPPARWGCGRLPSLLWSGQAPWSVSRPSHAARPVALIMGGVSRDPGVVPWRAVGRRSTRGATGTSRPRSGACLGRPALHDAERCHAHIPPDLVVKT